MMLKYSQDQGIRENPPEVRTGRKWIAEEDVEKAESSLRHKDIVGAVQTSRHGLGTGSFKPFCLSNAKEKRDAVVREVKRNEEEKGLVHLVQCAQQGQCLSWQECIVNRKISWKELWAWEPARTSFLLKSTYDVMPSPANLKRWNLKEDDKCRCGEYGTLSHILSHCKLGLEEGRYTWRHNQVLEVITKVLEEKIGQINEGKLPRKEVQGKVIFHPAEKRGNIKPSPRVYITDQEWEGTWRVSADLDNKLVFPIVCTQQRPDAVVWNEESKKVIILELTVPWESNIEKAKERKHHRYEELVEACEEHGWKTELHHLAVGCRGYVSHELVNLMRKRFGVTRTEAKKLQEQLQETAEKASFFIWLKREDNTWLEAT